jgi:hypothetical protein
MSNLKTNLIDWTIYSIIAAILLIPFFGGQYLEHLSASLLVGFLFGMLNRIIREVEFLSKDLYSEEVVELITNEMVKWTIDNVGNPDAKSSEKFDEIMKKYKDDE